MAGKYLSGTGNTKHCTEKLPSLLDENAKEIPIENENAGEALKNSDTIMLAYKITAQRQRSF